MTLFEFLHHSRSTPLPLGAHCLLCDRLPLWRGVFLPTDSVAYGGTGGKQRAIVYHLCKRCRRRSDVLPVVEARILAQLRARWN